MAPRWDPHELRDSRTVPREPRGGTPRGYSTRHWARGGCSQRVGLARNSEIALLGLNASALGGTHHSQPVILTIARRSRIGELIACLGADQRLGDRLLNLGTIIKKNPTAPSGPETAYRLWSTDVYHRPGNLLDHHATIPAVHASHAVEQETRKPTAE